jgi:hypothetical protein
MLANRLLETCGRCDTLLGINLAVRATRSSELDHTMLLARVFWNDRCFQPNGGFLVMLGCAA